MIYKSIAIIQARMGSSRLPGKMSQLLGDQCILEWVISRVLKATSIDHIVLATSTLESDNYLCKIANDLGVSVVRGSEDDVLSRFVKCLDFFECSSIVRICADNPFIDPVELNRLVDFFHESEFDYAFNHQNLLDNGIADGFGAEILSTDAIRLIQNSDPSQSQREHVTKYIWDNPNLFNFCAVDAPAALNYPQLRFDVDHFDDLIYLRSLVKCGISIDSSASKIVDVALSNPLLPNYPLELEVNNLLET